MSEVKRYDLEGKFPLSKSMRETSDGNYVLHSDYEKLKAQLERAEYLVKVATDCLLQCADQSKFMPGEYDNFLDKAREYFKEKESK